MCAEVNKMTGRNTTKLLSEKHKQNVTFVLLTLRKFKKFLKLIFKA